MLLKIPARRRLVRRYYTSEALITTLISQIGIKALRIYDHS